MDTRYTTTHSTHTHPNGVQTFVTNRIVHSDNYPSEADPEMGEMVEMEKTNCIQPYRESSKVAVFRKAYNATKTPNGDVYRANFKNLRPHEIKSIKDRVITCLNSHAYKGIQNDEYQDENYQYFTKLDKFNCPVFYEIDAEHSLQMSCCETGVSPHYSMQPTARLFSDKSNENDGMKCPVCQDGRSANVTSLNTKELHDLLEEGFKRRLVEPMLVSAQFHPDTGELLFNKGRFVVTVHSDEDARKLMPPTTSNPVTKLLSKNIGDTIVRSYFYGNPITLC